MRALHRASVSLRSKYQSAVPTLVLAALVLLGCVTTGPGGEKSFILISESEEIAIGRTVAAQVDSTETLLADSSWQRYLREVGEKIARVTDRSHLDYQFRVLDNDQVNAFAAPGGFIYFYTGLLRLMESEDELAAVMAHELSHVVARHGVRQMQKALGGALALSILLGEKSDETVGQIAGLGLQIALTGYGRSAETEADRFGVYYMTQAGYNPSGAIGMFEKLGVAGGEQGGRGFFESLAASHPETRDRIARVKAQIATYDAEVTSRAVKSERYQRMRRRLPPVADGN